MTLDALARTSSSSTDSTGSSRVCRPVIRSVKDYPFLDPTEFVFNCVYPDCSKKFTLTNDLYDHIREHSKELVCPRCDNKLCFLQC